MANASKTPNENVQIAPAGELRELTIDQIKPSANNPRQLFDPGPLSDLKESISNHGVLVPITVHKIKGQEKFRIIDGERRFRCCVDLLEETGKEIKIPANIVAPPTKVAGLVYMFSIHNFREQWELMPTALGLKTIMEDLGETETDKLVSTTGLSARQIERCKKLLVFPEKFTNLSLEPDPKKRIPSNFWIEALPVVDLIEREIPSLTEKLGRDGVIQKLVEKYRKKNIRSVIHFRRIMEAYTVVEKERKEILKSLEEYVLNTELETRAVFDKFIADSRRIETAVSAAEEFIQKLERAKLEYVVERDRLIPSLQDVSRYVTNLLAILEGDDPPEQTEGEGKDD